MNLTDMDRDTILTLRDWIEEKRWHLIQEQTGQSYEQSVNCVILMEAYLGRGFWQTAKYYRT